MKRLTLIVMSLLVAQVMLPVGQAFAQFDDRFCRGAGSGTAYCQNATDGNTTQNEITGEQGVLYIVVDYITTITLIASIIVILVASIIYITSSGDPSKANRARSAIIYAAIGLAASLMVRALVLYVLNRVGQALP